VLPLITWTGDRVRVVRDERSRQPRSQQPAPNPRRHAVPERRRDGKSDRIQLVHRAQLQSGSDDWRPSGAAADVIARCEKLALQSFMFIFVLFLFFDLLDTHLGDPPSGGPKLTERLHDK